MILLEAFQPYLHQHCPPLHTLVKPPQTTSDEGVHQVALPMGKQYLDPKKHFTLTPLECLHRWLVYYLLVDDHYDPHDPVRQVIRYHFTCMAPYHTYSETSEEARTPERSLLPTKYPRPFHVLSALPLVLPTHPEASEVLGELTRFCEQYEAWQYRRLLHMAL
ncbi:MAG: hypothetical protein ACKO37_04090 [Vampirovibrionales bacterium]